ncbi:MULTISPECIES: hypothetical protein [Paenibacillus]|uniref:MFS transporter n=1 Tax=Paenibacillus peoriae TaxID=59893 RepID=A0ABU1QNZ1_9BACL|nr:MULTISPECIES: hypothetical protein [Paenibacillus]MCP3748144.1 hypothetical protein [Paenibacillus sp. A3M_27_13]MDR6781366.1 hypothetical protein [Paenibacillus peoriae]
MTGCQLDILLENPLDTRLELPGWKLAVASAGMAAGIVLYPAVFTAPLLE